MTGDAFRERPDHELQGLSDEELIEYIVAARAAGRDDAGRRALQILVYGYLGNIERRVRIKVPAADVQDVARDAMVQALDAAFSGTSVGEFRSWLNTITDRTIVDYYRRRERRPQEAPLPEEHEGEEDVWGEEFGTESEAAAVEYQLVIDKVLAEFNGTHQRVIELYVFQGHSAAEAARQVSAEFGDMSEDNVHKIAQRFRDRLREELEGNT